MTVLAKAVIFGLFIAFVGCLVSMTPHGRHLEEEVGLGWLFKLRGPRPAPAEVVVVSMDRESADVLGVPNEPDKWPRSLHGRLVRNLAAQGASVIAFDVLFDEPRDPGQDSAFAQAIREAGNVVLCQALKRETIALQGGGKASVGTMDIERVVPPIPELARAAAALAPFPLPKVPVKVSQFWLSSPEGIPTLPVVALQLYGRAIRDGPAQPSRRVAPDHNAPLTPSDQRTQDDWGAERLASGLHPFLGYQPSLAPALLKELDGHSDRGHPGRHSGVLAPLVNKYDGGHSRYLDFYGPPRTITTIPYHRVLALDEKPAEARGAFAGKAVFVGFSEKLQPEQKDGYYTVFSEEASGLDISGVEIAATAFANLLEDRSVRPLRWGAWILLLAMWGVSIGLLFCLLPIASLPLAILSPIAGYLALAYDLFVRDSTWLPLAVPLLWQAPVALLGALGWRYLDVHRERRRIQETFGYYLPRGVVDALAKEGVKTQGKCVHGICLATDADRYTTLSERLEPERLHELMNRYYDILFQPVRQRGGIISDVLGDAMLAIWATGLPDRSLREQACLAALEIASAAERFNLEQDGLRLPTRIGLHCGELVLGNVGAADHYEYRAVGDIVNTATRVQSLNKHLGTRILVSQEILEGLDGFLSRALGAFLLKGKTVPILVQELVCRVREADAARRLLCECFADALNAFQMRRWDEATKGFREILLAYGEDGPSRYYLHLCERYQYDPPEPSWAGVVVVA